MASGSIGIMRCCHTGTQARQGNGRTVRCVSWGSSSRHIQSLQHHCLAEHGRVCAAAAATDAAVATNTRPDNQIPAARQRAQPVLPLAQPLQQQEHHHYTAARRGDAGSKHNSHGEPACALVTLHCSFAATDAAWRSHVCCSSRQVRCPAAAQQHARCCCAVQCMCCCQGAKGTLCRGVQVVSWWGPWRRAGSSDTQGVCTDDVLSVLLAEVEKLQPMKVALHLEPYPGEAYGTRRAFACIMPLARGWVMSCAGWAKQQQQQCAVAPIGGACAPCWRCSIAGLCAGRTVETVREDIIYLLTRHNHSSALQRIGGRPVWYMYDSYRIEADEWATLLAPNGTRTIRGTPLDGEWAREAPPQGHRVAGMAASLHYLCMIAHDLPHPEAGVNGVGLVTTPGIRVTGRRPAGAYWATGAAPASRRRHWLPLVCAHCSAGHAHCVWPACRLYDCSVAGCRHL